MASVHDITYAKAALKTQHFQTAYPKAVKGGKLPNNEVMEILSEPGCVGLRYYFALDSTSDIQAIQIVLVGVDQYGNDIVPAAPDGHINPNAKLKNGAWVCPPNCSTPNELNHL